MILFVKCSTFGQIVEYYGAVSISNKLYELCVTICLIFLSLIRSLRSLTYLSLGANILMFASHIVIFQYCIRNIQPLSAVPLYRSDERILLTVGIVVFCFGGISSVSIADVIISIDRHSW